MIARRIVASVLAIAFFAIAALRAQQPSKPPENSSKIGLLVAFVKDQRALGESPRLFQYETWWIVRDETGAHVVAKIPDIIVPRKTGFWRVGIQHTCQFRAPDKDEPRDHGEIITEDIPYSVPVEEAPNLSLNNPPCDPETRSRVLAPSYNPYAASSDEKAPSECVWKSASFLSVLPDFVSLSYNEGIRETCDPHSREEFSVSVRKTDTLSFVPISRMFGDQGRLAWNRAIRSAAKEGSCSEDPPPNEGGWYLEHFSGQWHATASLQWGEYRIDCVLSPSIGIVVPRSITHAAPLPVSWATLERKLSGLADAYISPDGSVLLTIVSKEDNSTHQWEISGVRLFDFSRHEVGPKLLDLRPNEVVMAEWATGRFVQSFTDFLTALSAHGLPAPVSEVPDASP